MASSRIAGWLIFAMVLLSIAHGLFPAFPRLPAGIAAWIAALLLVSRIKGLQKTQSLIMLLIGLAGLAYGLYHSGSAQLEKAITTNQSLLAMLAAVSFLRMVTLPTAETDEKLPVGRAALWRTLLGVHLFGAVINLSAVMILGDRLSAKRPLSALQATLLSRGFAMASHWSPFFAAMGIALTNAPGSKLVVLSLVGLPITVIGILIGGWMLSRQPDAETFIGYPMHFEALWVPGLLALAVLVLHVILPAIPILTIISLLSLALTFLLLTKRFRSAGPKRFLTHVETHLPSMSGELSLFLAAGVLAAGTSTAIATSGINITPDHFGPTEATYLLLAMVLISIIGVHPVISIATAGGIFAPIVQDPNLLAITFLMTWALGISTSPFSGMHLSMQGRYNLDSRNFIRWNGGFALLMLIVDAIALHLYAM